MNTSIKGIGVTILIVVMSISLSACNKPSNKEINIQDTVSELTYLMNLRYYGYNEARDRDRIESVIPSQSTQVIESLPKEGDQRVFISLEEYFKEYEEAIVEEELETGELVSYNPYEGKDSDFNIEVVDGIRGIYSDNIYIGDNNKFVTKIYGDTLYIPVPEEVAKGSMISNPSYRFKCTEYNYFDDGTLVVKFETDLEEAFKELYGHIEVVEDDSNSEITGDMGEVQSIMTESEFSSFKESFMNSNEIKRGTIKANIVEGKISRINIKMGEIQ